MIRPGELLALLAAAAFAAYVTGGIEGAVIGAGAVVIEMAVARITCALFPGRPSLPTRTAWATSLVLLAVALPFLAKDEFAISLLSRALVLSLIVLSLNVVTGYTGQISIGHAALVGIGAYGAAIGAGRGELPIVAAVAIGALAAGVVGLMIGVPALRLRGHYLGMVTLAITVAFPAVLQLHELEAYTGSFNGLSLFAQEFGPPAALRWLSLDRWYYFVALVIVTCAVGLVANLVASAAGRAMVATRDHEIAASSIGVNVALTKVVAFVLSAILAGLAGGLWFILNNRSVAPDGFTLTNSVEFLLALVVGGRASILGSILGGFFLVYVYQQWVQAFSLAFSAGAGGWADWIVVTLVFLAVTAWLLRSRAVSRFTRRLAPSGAAARIVGLAIAKLVLALAVGLAFLQAFRLATETILNLSALQPAFAGAVLLVVVLGAPGGLASLVKTAGTLTWREAGAAVREWFIPPSPKPGATDPRHVEDGRSSIRREASWV